MESVISHIQHNKDKKAITICDIRIPKVVAYADDVAILVANEESIDTCIKAYNEFCKCSGLFLNVEVLKS